MRHALIFGDSIAMGHNAPNMEGWAHHLKKFWEERDPAVTVINVARDGAKTTDVLSHLESDCEKYRPDEVVLAIGLNDSAYSFAGHQSSIPREKFEQNIEQILTIVEKHAKKIIIIGIGRVNEVHSTFSDENNVVYQYQNIVIQKFNDSLSGIAATRKAVFVPIFDLLSDDELDDGTHPTAKGHQKLFEAIKKVL